MGVSQSREIVMFSSVKRSMGYFFTQMPPKVFGLPKLSKITRSPTRFTLKHAPLPSTSTVHKLPSMSPEVQVASLSIKPELVQLTSFRS